MNVVTMYMIPISLWSVVVIQLVQPVALGSTSWAVTGGLGLRWWPSWGSGSPAVS